MTVHAAIDAPADGSGVVAGPVRIVGWVLDESGPLDAALIVAGDDGPRARARLGALRPDVGEAFASVPYAAASGFECDIDLRAAEAGELRVALVVRPAGEPWREVACTRLNVTAPLAVARSRRPRTAFTIVQNEPVMLRLWLDYYSRFFDAEDLYVLDHDSTDGSAAGLGDRCRVVAIHRMASFDHRWLRGTVEAFQAFLLRSYDTVLFAEVDEFIVADPRQHRGLDAYIDGLDRPAARCLGFNVVHQPGEPPLRLEQPLLAQRRCWHASLKYSKRLLSQIPLRWSEGFHEEYDAPDDPPDSGLLLVHLHRVDYDLCLARHRSSATRTWSADDVARGDGFQNRIAADAEFDRWFRAGPDLESPPELIPEHIRTVL